MNILILSDEIEQRKNFKLSIEEKFFSIRVYQGKNKEDGRKIITNNNIDLFFIDTKLKDGELGLDFAKELRRLEKYEITPIIFISDDISYMLEALKKTNCFDYLLKPFKNKEIIEIVNKFSRHNKNLERRDYIFLKDINKNHIKLYIKDILFLEYYLKICVIHTQNKTITIRVNGIENIIREINYKNIIRTHKSYAVNIDNIKEIKKVSSKLWNIEFTNYEKVAELSYNFKNKILG